jgi:hypothetical protein
LRYTSSARDVGQPPESKSVGAPVRRALRMSLILAFAVTVYAQTAAKTRHAPVSTAKPISEYMRRVGLSYLEQIDDFERECKGERDACFSALDRWDRVFEALEERITISLSEPGRPAGDKPFFELLRQAKDSTYFSRNAALARSDEPWWLDISANCRNRAHSDALDGTYNTSDDVCEINVNQQVLAHAFRTQTNCESEGFAWKEGAGPIGGRGACHAHFKTTLPDSTDLPHDCLMCQWRTQAECESAGFSWWDGACHAQK